MTGDAVEAAHAVLHAAYEDEAALIGAPEFPPLARSLADLVAAGTDFFGAWRDDALEGVIEVAGLEEARVVEVHALGVARAARRSGVARDLVRHVQARAGGRPVKVSTAVDNTPTVALYRALGFVRVSETVSREGLWLVHLRWNANAAVAG